MAEGRKGEVPGMLENWGTGTKNARPSSVGQHDPLRDPNGDESGPGIRPESGYKPGEGTQEGKAGPKGDPALVAGAGVIEAKDIKPGAERDAPPLRGTVEP